jgi:lysophospholipase L1-like esterase
MIKNRSKPPRYPWLADREAGRQGARFTVVLWLVFMLSATSTYYLVSIDKLNVFTGMLFLFAVSSFVSLVAETILKMLNLSSDSKNNIRLSLLTTIVMIFAMELFLRFGLDKYSNYHERNGSGDYVSPYSQNTITWFHTYSPNSNSNLLRAEFSHTRKINSLGIPEREIQRTKAPDEFRIVALGDSYTEGIGTSYDSTWIKVVEKTLNERVLHKKATTINAGVSGSDVYFEYRLLRHKLLSFNPDLVIVAVNGTDIQDIIARGGSERFVPGGTLRTRKGPKWEWIYGISYIFRHVIHDVFRYDWMFLPPGEEAREEQAASDKMKLALKDFSRLAHDYDFELIIVFHPQEAEIANGQYYPTPYHQLVDELKKSAGTHAIDLLDYYQTQRIITKENHAEFFWALDGHHNTRGYAVMGRAIAAEILALPFFESKVTHGSEKQSLSRKRIQYPDEDNEDKWRMQVLPGNLAQLVLSAEKREVVRIAISKAGTAIPWHIQLNQDGIVVKVRQRYVLTFQARADQLRTIGVAVSKAHEPWNSVGLYNTIALSQDWQSFNFEFKATEDDDNARIHFDVGGNGASVELTTVRQ